MCPLPDVSAATSPAPSAKAQWPCRRGGVVVVRVVSDIELLWSEVDWLDLEIGAVRPMQVPVWSHNRFSMESTVQPGRHETCRTGWWRLYRWQPTIEATVSDIHTEVRSMTVDRVGLSLSVEQRGQLDTQGFVVLPGVLSPEECDELTSDMDHAWMEHELASVSGSEAGVRFVANALYYSARVQRCLLYPLVLDAARAVVGPELLLNLVNGRSPGPGAAGQPLHDLTRRRGRPFDKCNAIWCLDEFTDANGATRVIPGSHLDASTALASMGDPMDRHPDEVLVEAPKGAVVFHNSHLIHSGRPNHSTGDRKSIHAAYTRPGVPTHYDWTALPPEIVGKLSEEMLDLLGLPASDRT